MAGDCVRTAGALRPLRVPVNGRIPALPRCSIRLSSVVYTQTVHLLHMQRRVSIFLLIKRSLSEQTVQGEAPTKVRASVYGS